jgi:hypothetical protein
VPLNNAPFLGLTTAFQDVYAPPSGVSVVSVFSILCCNRASTATDLTIALTNSANTILSHISFTIPIPVGSSFVPISAPIVVKPGQKLRALASQSGVMDMLISCSEFLT